MIIEQNSQIFNMQNTVISPLLFQIKKIDSTKNILLKLTSNNSEQILSRL